MNATTPAEIARELDNATLTARLRAPQSPAMAAALMREAASRMDYAEARRAATARNRRDAIKAPAEFSIEDAS